MVKNITELVGDIPDLVEIFLEGVDPSSERNQCASADSSNKNLPHVVGLEVLIGLGEGISNTTEGLHSSTLDIGSELLLNEVLELNKLLLDGLKEFRKVKLVSDTLDVLNPLKDEVFLSGAGGILGCLSGSRTNGRYCTSRLRGLLLHVAVAVYPVTE